MTRSISLVAAALAMLLAGCGARTGLDIEGRDAARPDAGNDAGHDAAFDAGPICSPDVRLLPAHADVVLVLDRSGSMTRSLASGGGLTRWDALRTSLAMALPSFDANVAFGATIFPIPDATIEGGTVCTTATMLDVPIALGSSPAILAAISAHMPSGGTPTADAITIASGALAARRRMGVPQSIVLATDGGPNCDPADASEPWFGQAPETCAEGGIDPQMCLDTRRSVDAIAAAFTAGVPTYVIAMDVIESYLVDALDQMAVAGGRARTGGGETFYDVRNPDDLDMALADITTRVSACSFLPDGDVPMDVIVIRVGDQIVPRDDSGRDGWSLGPNGTFDLHGPACDLASATGAMVRIDGVCH